MCVVYYACSRVSDVQNYAGNLSQSIQLYLYTCKCLSHNTNKITSIGHQMELYLGNPYYKHWNVTFVHAICLTWLLLRPMVLTIELLVDLSWNSVPYVMQLLSFCLFVDITSLWCVSCDKTCLHGYNFVCRHFYEWSNFFSHSVNASLLNVNILSWISYHLTSNTE